MSKMQDIVTAILNDTKKEIASNIISEGANASGRTIRSMHVEVKENSEGVEGVLYGRNYFEGLQHGRAGGKVPKGFRFIIRQWMRDKGIDKGNETRNNSMAYLIARKIALEGTKLYRKGGRTTIYTNAFDNAKKELVKQRETIIKLTVDKEIR